MQGILVTLKAFINIKWHNSIIPACLFEQFPKLANAAPSVHIFSVANTVFSTFSRQLSCYEIL